MNDVSDWGGGVTLPGSNRPAMWEMAPRTLISGPIGETLDIAHPHQRSPTNPARHSVWRSALGGRSLAVEQARLERGGHRRCPGVHAEFVEDVRDVPLHRARADKEI